MAILRGGGVAATCCAHLLGRAGLAVTAEPARRFPVPALMLGETAQKLLEDVFELPDLFAGLPRVRTRVVAWGSNASAVAVPHLGVVISEEALLDRIDRVSHPAGSRESNWTIVAARPLPVRVEEHSFGTRVARVAEVTLKSSCDPAACWIESLDDGWLFLLPVGDGRGSLLSVGGADLRASRLVAAQIVEERESDGKFAAHPRIADPLCGDGWLACGTAAIGFDPLCGDGTGNAVREAILGSAVIRAAAEGAEVPPLLAHYRARLTYGFRRHIEACRQFYTRGGSGSWWRGESAALERGLEFCDRTVDGAPSSRYRLNGFVLERMA